MALSFHAVFEGLAIGLESTPADVWKLFAGDFCLIIHSNFMFIFGFTYILAAIATHKFVIAFCIGLELMSAETRKIYYVIYMTTFALVSPLGIGIGIAITEGDTLESESHHHLTVAALQGTTVPSTL